MTSIERRTARIDDYIALIADHTGVPTAETVIDYTVVLQTADHTGELLDPHVVMSQPDPESACWLLCRAKRLLKRLRKYRGQRA